MLKSRISLLVLTLLFISSLLNALALPVEEERKVSKFNKLEISGAFEVVVTVGESQFVLVEGPKRYMDNVITEVSGRTLSIELEDVYNLREKIRITITIEDLTSLASSGANKVKVNNLKADSFNYNASGACKAYLEGSADRFIIQLSGACHLEADELKADKVKVDASGACHLEVYAGDYLDVEGSGAVKVRYSGDPKIDSDLSGAAVIRRR